MISGVQGGKTTCGVIWLTLQVQEDKKADYLVVFPTYRIGEQSTIKKFLERFPRNWGKYIIRDKVFRLKDGGNIYFRSAEDPQSLEGITARAAWIDEAGQINALAWETIRARLSIARGKAFLTTTPYAMNWLYSDFYKRYESGDPDFNVIQFRSVDSPWFPREEYEMRKKSMDARRFKLKYEGTFTRMEGLVYSTFDPDKHVIDAHKVPHTADVFCGVDYGYKNPAVILWAYRNTEGEVVVFKEHYVKGATIKNLSPLMNLHQPKALYVDPSAKGFMMELQNVYGVRNVAPADNDVTAGIARVQSLFNMDKIKIVKSCRFLIDELTTYRYKEETDGSLSDKVVKKDDHACDALRYLVNTGLARPSLVERKPKRHYNLGYEDSWHYG